MPNSTIDGILPQESVTNKQPIYADRAMRLYAFPQRPDSAAPAAALLPRLAIPGQAQALPMSAGKFDHVLLQWILAEASDKLWVS